MKLTPKKIGELLSLVADGEDSIEGVRLLAKLIVENRKSSKLGAIVSSFKKDYNKKNNLIDVTITASNNDAFPEIKTLAGRKVSLNKIIDPKVLGGVRILALDYLADNTVLSKVESIKNV